MARVENLILAAAINNEGNFHRNISNTVGLNKYVPKYHGQTYFKNRPVIKSEFIEKSIEEYSIIIHETRSSLGIVSLILQMFDAIRRLH